MTDTHEIIKRTKYASIERQPIYNVFCDILKNIYAPHQEHPRTERATVQTENNTEGQVTDLQPTHRRSPTRQPSLSIVKNQTSST
jgi:hypothetical protein